MRQGWATLSLFARLGRFTFRRRWPILLFWAVVLVTAALFAPRLGGQLKGGGFEGSGKDSELAKNLMVEKFGLPRANLVVVFEGDDLSARSAEYQRAEGRALRPLRNIMLVPATMRVVGDWNWWPGGRTSTFGKEAQRSHRTPRRGP